MNRTEIPKDKLLVKAHHIWAEQWLLLTAGDFEKQHFNCMTVAWGSIGTMWAKPFVQVVVRPVRYTYEFMEEYETFTLSAFPETHRKALALLGSKSGRNTDKIAECGLTPVRSQKVAAPCFNEAELVIECRKIYYHDFEPDRFLEQDIAANYPNRDYHRVYYGRVVAAFGGAAFSS